MSKPRLEIGFFDYVGFILDQLGAEGVELTNATIGKEGGDNVDYSLVSLELPGLLSEDANKMDALSNFLMLLFHRGGHDIDQEDFLCCVTCFGERGFGMAFTKLGEGMVPDIKLMRESLENIKHAISEDPSFSYSESSVFLGPFPADDYEDDLCDIDFVVGFLQQFYGLEQNLYLVPQEHFDRERGEVHFGLHREAYTALFVHERSFKPVKPSGVGIGVGTPEYVH